MKKAKNALLLALSFFVSYSLYNLCVFLLAKNYTGSFWVSYIFTTIAFITQITLPLIMVKSKSSKNEEFLTLPLMICGDVYFGVQLLLGIILMFVSASLTIAVIIEAFVFAVFLLISISVTLGKDYIASEDSKLDTNTKFIRNLTREAEDLYNSELNANKKKVLRNLFETIRYSDPISSIPEIKELDERIYSLFSILKDKVNNLDVDALSKSSIEIINLVEQRNNLCKFSK